MSYWTMIVLPINNLETFHAIVHDYMNLLFIYVKNIPLSNRVVKIDFLFDNGYPNRRETLSNYIQFLFPFFSVFVSYCDSYT